MTEVHNHGPSEGRGLYCSERVLPDGSLRGACIPDDDIQTVIAERDMYKERWRCLMRDYEILFRKQERILAILEEGDNGQV